MKKLLAVLMTAALVFAMAGCSNDANNVVQDGAAVNENGEEILGTAVEGAGKEVDMDKIEGTDLSYNANQKSSGKIDNYKVSIDNAKVTEIEGKKTLVVTFSYKNNGTEPVAFDDVLVVDAMQNDRMLAGTFHIGIEGINALSGSELMKKGEKTVVQKLYTLFEDSGVVTVEVYKYGEPDGERIVKSFSL